LIRTKDTGEIYLLSLDTFMIMAVMGLTLGTIFFIVNPNLVPGGILTGEVIKGSISKAQYERCLSTGENINGLNVDDATLWRYNSQRSDWQLTIWFEDIDSSFVDVFASGFNNGRYIEKEEISLYISRLTLLNNCLGL
tara:strand:+ start:314 stop:727 length:414 start_codon:yes stop_codon:yes gene_type:complete